jgi:hypothetical protein
MDIKIMPEKYKRRREAAKEEKLSLVDFLGGLVSQTNLWLVLSIILLILVVLAYFGLWGYQKSLIEEKTDLENQLAELTNQRDLGLEADFMELKNGIEDLKKVLKNRLYPSKFFEMLEELTLPQVQFTGLDTDFPQAKLTLEAEAVDYTTLAKQIVVFEEDERIEKISLSGVNLDLTGRVKSTLNIEINLDFLRP